MATDELNIIETVKYGSDRLGVRLMLPSWQGGAGGGLIARHAFSHSGANTEGEYQDITPSGSPVYSTAPEDYFSSLEGAKHYELKNHLGNVLATVSDKRDVEVDGSYNVESYTAKISDVSFYYPFGSLMPGLSDFGGEHRFGFNGKESDSEVKGRGNQQDYGMRIYDARLCRFLSIDPITKEFPWLTPYQFASNNPIIYIDLDGLEGVRPGISQAPKVGLRTYNSINQQGYNLRMTYQPNQLPRQVAPATQYRLFEETRIPGGSCTTDPLVTRNNIPGHLLNILGEGYANIREYESKVSDFKVTETVFNAGGTNHKTFYDIKFASPELQALFDEKQAAYQAKFDAEMGGTKPPDITKYDFNSSSDSEKYNSQMAEYNLKYAVTKSKLGLSPSEKMIELVKTSGEMNKTVTYENQGTIAPAPAGH